MIIIDSLFRSSKKSKFALSCSLSVGTMTRRLDPGYSAVLHEQHETHRAYEFQAVGSGHLLRNHNFQGKKVNACHSRYAAQSANRPSLN